MRACVSDSVMDCCAAVCDLLVRLAGFLNTSFGVSKDLFRIFRAWIVGSENHDIAQTARSFAHRRSLGTVQIAATAKDSDDSSLRHVARSAQNIQERVVA